MSPVDSTRPSDRPSPGPSTRYTLLITCVADVLAPDVAGAAVDLVRSAGGEVSCDLDQTCCGQPAWNAGFVEDAAAVARPTLEALAAELDRGADGVVVPAGSCTTMVRLYWPELFTRTGDDEAADLARRVAERTWELSQVLTRHRDRLPRLSLTGSTRVAVHRGCHLTRELHAGDLAGQLLDSVEGCDVVSWEGDDRCCGFGGTFSVNLPETSVAMADEKLQAVVAADSDLLVSCDSSCLLHLRARAEAAGTPVDVRHVAEVLADALPHRRSAAAAAGPTPNGSSA